MKLNKNVISNNRGFTLIELLAVIVVLAIVMLIAVNAVLPQMDQARRNAFAIEVNGLIKSAQQYVVTESLTSSLTINKGSYKCITLKELIDKGHSELDKDKYSGIVQVAKNNNNIFLYKVSLKNQAFMVIGKGVMGISGTSFDTAYNVSISEANVQARDDAAFAKYMTCDANTPSFTAS